MGGKRATHGCTTRYSELTSATPVVLLPKIDIPSREVGRVSISVCAVIQSTSRYCTLVQYGGNSGWRPRSRPDVCVCGSDDGVGLVGRGYSARLRLFVCA